MVLGFVWDALMRSESPEARRDSHLWRLMERDVPNILRATAGSSAVDTQQSNNTLAVDPMISSFLSDEWLDLLDETGMPR